MIPSAARYYWRLNDPYCSERHSNTEAKIINAVEWPEQPPKIAPSPWGICTTI